MQTKPMGDTPYHIRAAKCAKRTRIFNAGVLIKTKNGLAPESEGSSPKQQASALASAGGTYHDLAGPQFPRNCIPKTLKSCKGFQVNLNSDGL